MAVSGTSGSIQIAGIASGLDTDGIIEQLLNIERIPLQTVDQRETDANNELAAWRSLNTRILAFETSLNRLDDEETFSSRKAAVSDETVAVATAGAGKDLGVYDLTVLSKASRHQQISTVGYSTTTDSIGEGTVTIQVGSAVFDPLTIDSENASLEGLRDSINAGDYGVSASILDTGEINGADRYKLVLNSSKTGTAAALNINFALSGGDPGMVDLTAARDAEVQVGSGINAITITSSSNTIEDFLPGVTLDVLKAQPDESVQMTVAADRSGLESQIEGFIDNYNQMNKFFTDQFDFNEESKSTGVLFGDSSLISLQNDMVNAATDQRFTGGDFASLAQIGISLNELGDIRIEDRDAFEKALDNPDDLYKLFNDPEVGVVSKLKDVFDEATTTTTGIIANKEANIQQDLEDLKDKRLQILRFVDKKELLLRQQFADMERTLSALQSQSNQLAAQLGGFAAQP